MERYTYFDGGKWRLKIGDTEYSGDWVERLAASASWRRRTGCLEIPYMSQIREGLSLHTR